MRTKKWPPPNYVWAFDPKSYHNDPAQQHGTIAEDKLREKTITRLKNERRKLNGVGASPIQEESKE